jgi:hypothetical protein
MKVNAVVDSRVTSRTTGTIRAAEVISGATARRLTQDLQQELEAILHSELPPDDADPDLRRDALERAVRRIWGATL